MDNQQILERAIQKAIDGGWRPNDSPEKPLLMRVYSEVVDFGYDEYDQSKDWRWTIDKLIFNHDFAKALWGDKFINPEMRDDTGSRIIAIKQTAWRHHLRQMVIADDPIKYLGEHI